MLKKGTSSAYIALGKRNVRKMGRQGEWMMTTADVKDKVVRANVKIKYTRLIEVISTFIILRLVNVVSKGKKHNRFFWKGRYCSINDVHHFDEAIGGITQHAGNSI